MTYQYHLVAVCARVTVAGCLTGQMRDDLNLNVGSRHFGDF